MSDPAFGLQAAQCWHPSNLGVLGYAWLSSSTLRTALGRMVCYWRIVIADVAVALNESPDGVEFVHTPPPLDDDLDRVRGNMAMAILFDMCRTNFGRALTARRVAFRHAAPIDTQPYKAFFGCPVLFGADANRFLISRADADHPLSTANRQLAAVHDHILVEELTRLDKTNVMARIRASLLERMASGELSEEDSARDLHMSRRSLQRRLAEADATYQSLVDDTRRDLALRYIEDPAKSARHHFSPRLLPAKRVHARFPPLDRQESVGIPLAQFPDDRLIRQSPFIHRTVSLNKLFRKKTRP